MEEGYDLELTIVNGRDLAVKDVKTSDPYVVFDVEGTTFKTKVISNTLNPDWNQKFKVKANKGTKITFNCWDHDVVGDDDNMGICNWEVPQYRAGQEEIYVLKNDMKGQITIKVKCLAGGLPMSTQILPQRIANSYQTVLVQVQSVERVESAYNAEKLKDPQREVLQFKGASTTSLCGVSGWVFKNELSADKRKKMDTKDFYITTSQDIEKIEITLLASQKAKKGNESVCGRGQFMVKLMREKDREFHSIRLTNGVIVHFSLLCYKSVWDNVNPAVIDKYLVDVKAKMEEMKATGLYTSVSLALPEEPKKEEPAPAPVVEEPKKEEPAPAPVAQPAQPVQQQMPMQQVPMQQMPGMYTSFGMQPQVVAQPMMGSMLAAQPTVVAAQPAVVANPMMGSVLAAQPAVVAAQPTVVAQPAVVAQPVMTGSIVQPVMGYM